jgi:hypothetical protein
MSVNTDLEFLARVGKVPVLIEAIKKHFALLEWFSYCTSVTDPDPHGSVSFGKPDPDPH